MRAKKIDIDKVPVAEAPDLGIKIISLTERSLDTHQKLESYLRAGAQEVWQIYPKSQSVVLHRDGAGVILAADRHL